MVPIIYIKLNPVLSYLSCNCTIFQDAISASTAAAPATSVIVDPRLASYAMVSSSGSVPPPTAQASLMQLANVQFSQPAALVKPIGQVVPLEPSLHSSPAREEGEVPESELDPDTRRRLLILQHGQDTREHAPSEPPFPVRHPVPVPVPLPVPVSAPRVPPRGGWFPVEDEMGPQPLSRVVSKDFPVDSEPLRIEKHRPHHPSFFPKVESSVSSDRIIHESPRLPKEVLIMLCLTVKFESLLESQTFDLFGELIVPN